MQYKHPGIDRRDKQARIQRINNMMKFMSGEKLEPKKERKERADKGASHRKPEEELRNDIIKDLRKSGFKVKRIENSITGKNNIGLPDLLVIHRHTNIFGFIEVKTHANWKTNKLKEKQLEFRTDCRRCGVKHWVVRSIEELQGVKLGITNLEKEIDEQ